MATNLTGHQTDGFLNKHIYIFSGLGADERVFQNLNFSGMPVSFIKWVIPDDKETIENYAKRILTQITTNKPTLIGLSFGGLMAIEVAKQIDTDKVILIASAKTKSEIPFYYRIAGQMKIHRLLPTKLLKNSNLISNWLFGVSSNFDKGLLKTILKETNIIFLKWAIDKVVTWKSQTRLKNITHIHGTADMILPIRFVTADFKITNGGHLMTLNKANELTEILRELV